MTDYKPISEEQFLQGELLYIGAFRKRGAYNLICTELEERINNRLEEIVEDSK